MNNGLESIVNPMLFEPWATPLLVFTSLMLVSAYVNMGNTSNFAGFYKVTKTFKKVFKKKRKEQPNVANLIAKLSKRAGWRSIQPITLSGKLPKTFKKFIESRFTNIK
jgi:hypothetical protein